MDGQVLGEKKSPNFSEDPEGWVENIAARLAIKSLQGLVGGVLMHDYVSDND
ncbi:hypothetical protein ACFVJ4_38380 [Streptomyces sp. NPDC127178]|uniref:hypothetical protein n=1 Tax=unclassified Streptomyces TaxID=2593676 RepID=UPI0036351A0D